MKNNPSEFRKYRSGFTLIEVLVAMAITSVIMIALFSLVGQSTDSYTRTQRAVNTISQARAFMQFFEEEITKGLPGTPVIHESNSAEGPTFSDKIAFVRTIPIDAQNPATPGDLGTTFYYVAFSEDKGSGVSPKLFRKILPPDETLEFIESVPTPVFPDEEPNSDEPIIHNILSFEARLKFLNPDTREFEDWAQDSPQPPSRTVLTIRFIDDSSSQRFTSESEWNRLATSPRETEVPLIRTFTRTLPL
ncbi:MAG: type II secretion system protein J [Akkermansiaceae bacterium]